MDEAERPEFIVTLHAAIDVEARRLHVLHAARLHCERGCSACCVDELTVTAVEARHIRRHHAALLASGEPHPIGACAFLDEAGACRVFAERPYVCRTQGLPLRWLAEGEEGRGPDQSSPTELRDICPLNEAGEPIEFLRADDCWTLGPVEERLARLQLATDAPAERVRLRSLFGSGEPR